jgi:hypothetical protein
MRGRISPPAISYLPGGHGPFARMANCSLKADLNSKNRRPKSVLRNSLSEVVMRKTEEQGSLLPRLHTLSAIAGAVLCCCPFVLDYGTTSIGFAHALISGMVLVIMASIAATDIWPTIERACFGLGAWITAAPWIVNFDHLSDPLISHIVVGIVAMSVSLICLLGRSARGVATHRLDRR